MIYEVLTDKQSFKQKPTAFEAGEIQNRLKKKRSQELDFKQLVKYIEGGHSLKFGKYEKDFKIVQRDIFVFDIDDGGKIEDWKTVFNMLGIDIFILYKTFSHTEENHRFRILIKLNFNIKSKEFYTALFNEFDELFLKHGLGQDKSLKDWTKLVYGSNKECVIKNEFSRPLDITQFFKDVVYTRSLNDEEIKDYIVDGMFSIRRREKHFDVNSSITRDIELSGSFTAFETYLRAYFKAYGKPEYTTALKWASGLSNAKMFDLFYDTIPEHKLKEYVGFERTLNNEKQAFYTKFFKGLYDKFLKDNFYIKKYLSESQIKFVLESQEKNILCVAGTGTGKTHGFVNYLREKKEKFIFAVPSVALVEQGSHNFKIKGCCGKTSIIDSFSGVTPSMAFCTYNKLADLYDIKRNTFKDHTLIIDECHLLPLTSDFRGDVIYKLLKVKDLFKKVIFITATAEVYPNTTFDKRIEFTSDDDKEYNVKFIQTPSKIKVADTIDRIIEVSQAEKFIVLSTKDKILNSNLTTVVKNSISFNADTKHLEEHEHFVKTGLYPKGIKTIIATDIFSAGLNVNEDIERAGVIVSGDIDKSTLKQLVARFRKAKKIDIYYVYKNKRENKNFQFHDLLLKNANLRLPFYNVLGSLTNKGTGEIEIKDDYFVYNKKTKNFEVFPELVYRSAYKMYCNKCSLEHLFSLFPENRTTFEYEFFDKDYAVTVEGRGRKTAEEKEEQIEKDFIALSQHDFDNVSEKAKEKYDDFSKNGLSHALCVVLASGKADLNKIRAYVMSKALNGLLKSHLIEDNFYEMVKFICSKKTGQLLNIADICKKNSTFKAMTLKKVIEGIWEFEEIKEIGTRKRYLKIKCKKNNVEFISKKDEKELIKNKFILGLKVGF